MLWNCDSVTQCPLIMVTGFSVNAALSKANDSERKAVKILSNQGIHGNFTPLKKWLSLTLGMMDSSRHMWVSIILASVKSCQN